MKRVLQTFRDGREMKSSLNEPMAEGMHGNLQTLERMCEIVREDRLEPDLRIFILREIVGDVRGHSFLGELERCFDFAQHRITYRKDPFGVERVADIWSTLYALNPAVPEGDCGIKSLFFSSCAAILGHKPFFVVIKQRPEATVFDHVYAAVAIDGNLRFYDPTPEDKPSGFEPQSWQKFLKPIF